MMFSTKANKSPKITVSTKHKEIGSQNEIEKMQLIAAKVLITTGIGVGPTTSSEVVDFSQQSSNNTNCTNFVDFPVDTFGATGQMTNLPIICGGEGRDHPSVDACYSLTKDQTTQIASMIYKRSGAASVPIKNNSALWITGGQNGVSKELLLATEIMDIRANGNLGSARLSIDLPLPVSGHCLIRLNDHTLYLIGGKSSNGTSSRTFYLNLESTTWSTNNNGNWTEGPHLKHPRYLHSCGMQGTKVIVSGGRNEDDFEMDSVESLELQEEDAGNPQWIQGIFRDAILHPWCQKGGLFWDIETQQGGPNNTIFPYISLFF